VFYWTANEEIRESLEIAEEEAADHTDDDQQASVPAR
jgi:hypothetical protein